VLHKVHVPRLKHPIFLRAKTSDVIVFNQIFIDAELDFEVRNQPSRIVDAGANIGLASVYFASRFPNARIVALEVEQANFELLKRNTEHYPNITCLQKALWSGQKQLSIVNPTDEPWAFRVSEAVSGIETLSVMSLGVSDMMQEFDHQQIDLLKIDIEGAEKEIFQNGMDHWIGRVGMIAVELHDRIVPGCKKALEDGLSGRDYRMLVSGEYTIVDLTSY
jgi:FkbM family methyltransferase